MTTKLTKELINESDNKSTKELTKKSTKTSTKKSTKELTKQSINEPNNQSINEPVSSNTTSWYDTDKFNKILATFDNNNFNHKNKIAKLKFNGINYLINSIKGNTLSETDTKKKLNELNEIKK